MQKELILILHLRESQVKLLLSLLVLHLEPTIYVGFVDLEILQIDLQHYFFLLLLAEDQLVVEGKHQASVDFFWRVGFVLFLFLSIGDVPTCDGYFLQKLVEVSVELFLDILECLLGYTSIQLTLLQFFLLILDVPL